MCHHTCRSTVAGNPNSQVGPLAVVHEVDDGTPSCVAPRLRGTASVGTRSAIDRGGDGASAVQPSLRQMRVVRNLGSGNHASRLSSTHVVILAPLFLYHPLRRGKSSSNLSRHDQAEIRTVGETSQCFNSPESSCVVQQPTSAWYQCSGRVPDHV